MAGPHYLKPGPMTRVELDQLSFSVATRDELDRTTHLLHEHGMPFEELIDQGDAFGHCILAFRIPDNLQFVITVHNYGRLSKTRPTHLRGAAQSDSVTLGTTDLSGIGQRAHHDWRLKAGMHSPLVDSQLRHHLPCKPTSLSTVDSKILLRSCHMLGALGSIPIRARGSRNQP
jgi:hypothetical protein